MHMDVSQTLFHAQIYSETAKGPQPGPLFRAGLRSRKCTWACHKRHFMQKFTRKLPDAPASALVSCGPAQSKCTWTCQKSNFMRKFTRKLPESARRPQPGPLFHAGLGDRKCTWTCHKSHFLQKKTRKLPDAPASALVSCGPAQSKWI